MHSYHYNHKANNTCTYPVLPTPLPAVATLLPMITLPYSSKISGEAGNNFLFILYTINIKIEWHHKISVNNIYLFQSPPSTSQIYYNFLYFFI